MANKLETVRLVTMFTYLGKKYEFINKNGQSRCHLEICYIDQKGFWMQVENSTWFCLSLLSLTVLEIDGG